MLFFNNPLIELTFNDDSHNILILEPDNRVDDRRLIPFFEDNSNVDRKNNARGPLERRVSSSKSSRVSGNKVKPSQYLRRNVIPPYGIGREFPSLEARISSNLISNRV